jgi:hypothetical protein
MEGYNVKTNNSKLLARLTEIHEACCVATLPEDNNLNLIIEEIDRLTSICINQLAEE